jgi:hypothetical protein
MTGFSLRSGNGSFGAGDSFSGGFPEPTLSFPTLPKDEARALRKLVKTTPDLAELLVNSLYVAAAADACANAGRGSSLHLSFCESYCIGLHCC